MTFVSGAAFVGLFDLREGSPTHGAGAGVRVDADDGLQGLTCRPAWPTGSTPSATSTSSTSSTRTTTAPTSSGWRGTTPTWGSGGRTRAR